MAFHTKANLETPAVFSNAANRTGRNKGNFKLTEVFFPEYLLINTPLYKKTQRPNP